MLLLDGKAVANTLRVRLACEIDLFRPKVARGPCLAVVLVGDNHASQIYVRNKERACVEAGIKSFTVRLGADISQRELENCLDMLSLNDAVDGILLQLPLPPGLNPQPCLELIRPDKDVDGLHPVNQGRLASDQPGLRPCTPAGVMALLKHYYLSVEGKKAVVVGRSNLVGRPLSLLLASRQYNATVTMCNSFTQDLKAECLQADFLFLAMGMPRLITEDMVKEGAVVIDIGINRLPHGGLCGDADFEGLLGKASAMTPVPGGIGPMTIVQLLINTVQAWKQHMQGQSAQTDAGLATGPPSGVAVRLDKIGHYGRYYNKTRRRLKFNY